MYSALKLTNAHLIEIKNLSSRDLLEHAHDLLCVHIACEVSQRENARELVLLLGEHQHAAKLSLLHELASGFDGIIVEDTLNFLGHDVQHLRVKKSW